MVLHPLFLNVQISNVNRDFKELGNYFKYSAPEMSLSPPQPKNMFIMVDIVMN